MRQLEMAHDIVEAGKNGARVGLDHRALDVIAGKSADRRQRLPQGDGDELDFCAIRDRAPQEIGAAVACDRRQFGEHLGGDECS